MIIKNIIWRRYFFSQLRRNFLSINFNNDDWSHQRADHALEWGNDLNQNLWTSVVKNIGPQSSPTKIRIQNSINPLKLWRSNNSARKNPIKINQEYWQYDSDRFSIWFYNGFQIAYNLMNNYLKQKAPEKSETIFQDYLKSGLERIDTKQVNQHIYLHNWMRNELNLMKELNIDMSWFFTSNNPLLNQSIIKFVKPNYLIFLDCEFNGEKKYFISFVPEKDLNIFNKKNLFIGRSYGVVKVDNQKLANDFHKIFKPYVDDIMLGLYNETNIKDYKELAINEIANLKLKQNENDEIVRIGKLYVRKSQAKLRKLYFGDSKIAKCGVCSKSYKAEFLWISHLKKYTECSPNEKLDPLVVMPMCLFGCDKLYEEGYIYIDNGVVKSNEKQKKATSDMLKYIEKISEQKCYHWHNNRQKYCNWHIKKHG